MSDEWKPMSIADLPADLLAEMHPATQFYLIEAAPPPGATPEQAAAHWMGHAAGMFSKWMKERQHG